MDNFSYLTAFICYIKANTPAFHQIHLSYKNWHEKIKIITQKSHQKLLVWTGLNLRMFGTKQRSLLSYAAKFNETILVDVDLAPEYIREIILGT